MIHESQYLNMKVKLQAEHYLDHATIQELMNNSIIRGSRIFVFIDFQYFYR